MRTDERFTLRYVGGPRNGQVVPNSKPYSRLTIAVDDDSEQGYHWERYQCCFSRRGREIVAIHEGIVGDGDDLLDPIGY